MSVDVNLNEEKASVDFDESRISLEDIISKVTDAGYDTGKHACHVYYTDKTICNYGPEEPILDDRVVNGKDIEDGPVNNLVLRISGMHCSACALNIEKALKRQSGILSASVNLSHGKGINSLLSLSLHQLK